MSDNRRRLRAIHSALKRLYPTPPQGNQARHLFTLSMLISGIVGNKGVHLPTIAAKVPSTTKVESRVKRFCRWISNSRVDYEGYYLPYAQQVLANLAHQTLVFVMDGSGVGRGCRTLMLSVIYKKRALPIAWLVAKGSSGNFAEADHICLLEQVIPMLPDCAKLMFLGDGEFDGVDLQRTLTGHGFGYVCRTAKDTIISRDGELLTFEALNVCPGTCIIVPDARFTHRQYGPIQAIAWWDHGEKEPLYLVSNLSLSENPCQWYRARFTIETFFSDQKSRGFHLHKSHISDPERLAQLMIAACLDYLWIIYLGNLAIQHGFDRIIHRTDRCDLSLFQLGLRLLDYYLNHGLPIPTDLSQLESAET